MDIGVMASLSECYLLPLTKSVERTVNCTFNSSEPLFPVPQNICYCSLVLELNLHSNQIELLFFWKTLLLKVFQVQSPLLTSQDIYCLHFPWPRMQYRCSKLYLHITVTANYWPKYSAELHNARIFLVLRSYCGSNIFLFLKIVIDQR